VEGNVQAGERDQQGEGMFQKFHPVPFLSLQE